MKKFLSVLLVAVMIMAVVPVISVSAEAVPTDTVKVTNTYDAPGLDAGADVWNINFIGRRNQQLAVGTVIHEGKFEVPTVISEIYVRVPNNFAPRVQRLSFEGSVDGKEWVEIARVGTLGNNAASYVNKVICLSVNNETAFNHIRIKKNQDGWLSEASYGVVAARTDYAKIDYFSQHKNFTDANSQKVWDPTFSSRFNGQNIAVGEAIHTGKFAEPTVIDQFVVKVPAQLASRLNKAIVEASVDGVEWTQITTLKTEADDKDRDSHNIDGNKRLYTKINDPVAYNYIRIVKGQEGWWSAASFGVIPGAKKDAANFVGHQSLVEGNSWKLRLISTVDDLRYQKVGYEIAVTGGGLAADRSWDKATSVVYTSIMANDVQKTAAELGGKYIVTATLQNISVETYGALTFTVKPYVINENGEKIYSATQTFIYNDGVQVVE